MTNRRGVALVVLLAAAVAGVWWWKGHRRSATPATSTLTQPSGGSASSSSSAPATNAVSTAPASASVQVTDANGPVADASVRLAPEEGDVVVVKTGADGIAHADTLAPGSWDVSASATGHEPAALESRELQAGAKVELAITLVAGGRTLSGLVTDATGGPVAGARIDAARLGGMMRPGHAVATTVTAADGKYALSVAEGQLMVEVSSSDYAAQSRYVEVGPTGATADFQLVPGGAIEGIVRDAKSGEVIAGAYVQGRRDGGGMLALAEGGGHVARSGPDGRFRLSGLRPGAYEIGAHAETRSSKSPTIVGIGVAEQVTDVEVLISAGPVVHGVVLDESKTPVPNITVTANGQGRGAGADAKTDAKGAFTITGLAAGHYFVMASDDAYVTAGPTQLELADHDIDKLEVRVRHAATIVGHVEPRQPCEIQHEPDESSFGAGMMQMIAPTTSGADGVFRLGPAAPGKAKLVARCSGGDQGTVEITVSVGMPEVVLPVKPGASIAGRVVDGEGKPVGGVTVMGTIAGPTQSTMIVNGMVTSGVQALTASNGTYVLNALAAGTYSLRVLDRGKPLRLRGKPVQATVGATDKKTGVEIAIDRPNGVIKGVVTTADGKPLADAWVSVHQDLEAMIEGVMGEERRGADAADGEGSSRMITVRSEDEDGGGEQGFAPALTDAQGRFQIGNLPHATYEVIAEAQAGKLRGRVARITPDASVTIQAMGVTTLSGTVHGAKGATPLFTVELDGPTTAARTFTDGKFQLGRVDVGAYTVRVTSADGNAEATVQVLPGQPATVDIPLVANAIVIGKLVDPQGKPLVDVGLALIPDSGDGRVKLSMDGPPPTSGADGSFRLEAKAGKSILLAMTPPRPFTKRGLTLEAGKTLDLGNVTVDSGPPPGP
ncbi:hypothetical protein BH11MYX3_BH11MYX3_04860 [soil metagenome]